MVQAISNLSDAQRRVSDSEPVLVRLEAAVLAARLAMAEPDFDLAPDTPAAVAELFYGSLERAAAEAAALQKILFDQAEPTA